MIDQIILHIFKLESDDGNCISETYCEINRFYTEGVFLCYFWQLYGSQGHEPWFLSIKTLLC